MERVGEPALRDDLTGLLNRRYLREFFASEWADMLEESGSVAILLLDLDLFKEVNDRHGHLVGDEVLRHAAERLEARFREHDLLVRYGGDEFVVVLPGAGAAEAFELAARIRRALVEDQWLDPGSGEPLGLPISFSIGSAAAPADGVEADQVLAVADRRLYEDKRRRRERRGRKRALAVAAIALVAASLVGWLGWQATRPAALPEVGAASVPLPAAEIGADDGQAEAELIELRAEVERLKQALEEDRPGEEVSRFEARIRELESTLKEASRPAASARDEGPSPGEFVADEFEGGAGETGETPPPPRPGLPNDSPPGSRVIRPRGPGAASPGGVSGPPSGTVFLPAVLLSHERPDYPLLARRRRASGAVEFRVWVDSRGRVAAVAQTSPQLGFGLDEAARQAALAAVYRPARRAGMSIDSETTLTIRFVLGE